MSEPLASVVIITYNQEKYFKQTIECALAQKVDFEYEIVIGEDCSTDNTREICYRYQLMYPNKIRVITSDKNVGLLDNYYRTVKAARGKYVAVCGGDDYWHNQEKLQKQVEFLENNPEYGMVHSEVDCFIQKSGIIIKNYHSHQGHYYGNSSKKTLEGIVSSQYIITASTATFRKSMYDKYFNIEEFKRNGFLVEDTPFFAEIAAHSKVHYVPEALATYRVLDESASNSKDIIKHLRFWKSQQEMNLSLCDKHKLPENVRKIIESAWFDKTLQLAFYERNAGLALEVKRKKQEFTLKEWLRYFGAKYLVIHYGCRSAILFLALFRKQHEPLS
jgi:glycosyltransferase involved in cell wall biosynthesis